jgi:hypothetical protein
MYVVPFAALPSKDLETRGLIPVSTNSSTGYGPKGQGAGSVTFYATKPFGYWNVVLYL